MCVSGACGSQKKVLDSLELKLHMVVSRQVDDGDGIWSSVGLTSVLKQTSSQPHMHILNKFSITFSSILRFKKPRPEHLRMSSSVW